MHKFVRMDVAKVINENQLKIRTLKSGQLLVNSVHIPPAQSIIQCDSGTSVADAVKAVGFLLSDASGLTPTYKTIISLQYEHGLRISEVLNLTWDSYLGENRLVLKSSKKSDNRVLWFSDKWQYLALCKVNAINPFLYISRFAVHRFYKKNGLYVPASASHKGVSTHLFRHHLASKLHSSNVEGDLISDVLRHKNKENKKFYINKV